MKRSWAWPVLMAIVLPGGLLIAAVWLLARAKQASPGLPRGAGASAALDSVTRWFGEGVKTRWSWPTAPSRRWEWPVGVRTARSSTTRPDTLH